MSKAAAARPPRVRGGNVGTRQRHAVRIVGGDWKRTLLPVLDAPGLRPTPDRVRETLFNWLGQRIDGWRCIDAFTGTGALAFEAASRGAAEVIAIDAQPRVVAALEALCLRLATGAVRPQRGDAIALMTRLAQLRPGEFDLVFLDPPFDGDLLARALPLAATLVAPGGLVYVESGRAADAVDAAARLESWRALGLEPVREGRAGQVDYHLLQRTESRGDR